MCDYSLMHAKSRPANVADKLVVKDFGRGTRGFASPSDPDTAVCVLPGTEIAFASNVCWSSWQGNGEHPHQVAIFRQINKDRELTHHDVLEFPDGTDCLLTYVAIGQEATILQLPAAPKNEAEAKEQTRIVINETVNHDVTVGTLDWAM